MTDCVWIEQIEQIKGSLSDLLKIGHHVPLKYLSRIKMKEEVSLVDSDLSEPIKSVPFSNLLGKKLFGIQCITECETCRNYYEEHKCLEQRYIKDGISWGCSLCYKTSEYIKQLDLNEHNTITNILKEFVTVKWDDNMFGDLPDSDNSSDDDDSSEPIDSSDWVAELHPRLWLFVGDSINTFKNYLLFNSNHGHPHIDNWNLVEWNLTQPPATDKLKVISSVINNIKLYQDDFTLLQTRYLPDFDKWVKYSGQAKNTYEVPTDKMYPMVRIDTNTKVIGLGVKWFFCHYPQSVWKLMDKECIDRRIKEKEKKERKREKIKIIDQ